MQSREGKFDSSVTRP
nr:unnamed protein product [Callosobruchus chinensis]CAH7721035.1 unnamed protein product [Callosobruchus chinensis]CAH7723068.1 unnamed protein product [Callosobruchus chinensis]CAH7726266.1 unnamed protein product [Callosobruchus chinensis]CAH7751892.1 unnamed protein product [Callosobruchus chinensis]